MSWSLYVFSLWKKQKPKKDIRLTNKSITNMWSWYDNFFGLKYATWRSVYFGAGMPIWFSASTECDKRHVEAKIPSHHWQMASPHTEWNKERERSETDRERERVYYCFTHHTNKAFPRAVMSELRMQGERTLFPSTERAIYFDLLDCGN